MLSVEKIMISGIPCFEIMPLGEVPKADILLYHGWGSHATKQCFRGKLLAGFGYRVIVPEIALHGERGECCYEESSSAIVFLEVLLQSINEAKMIIREGMSRERACFVCGHSLGGMIALGAACENSDVIDGFIAMNSTADWSCYEDIMRGVYPNQSLDILNSEAFKDARKALLPYAPSNWTQQDMMRPVLLTNGELDQTLPLTFNARFCADNPSLCVKQILFPDAGHVVTDGMLSEVLGFIEHYTKPRG